MSKSLVFKGFSARFGYMHTDPGAIRYVLKNTGEVFEGIMGYMSNEDLRFFLGMPITEALEKAA
jgi:hypothetical protein